jgi:mRNA interferase MazF
MKDKDFDQWNEVKKKIEIQDRTPLFKNREIFNTKIGENIGFEQCGKGDESIRPVLIFKKLTKEMFLGIPLSTTEREGSFFFKFEFIDNIQSTALLVQIRLFSSKRLINKIGMIKKQDFEVLNKKLCQLLFDFTPPNDLMGRPEGNYINIIPQSMQNNQTDFDINKEEKS